MAQDRVNWRLKTRRAALALAVAASPFAYQGGSAVQAQSIMRSPNLNIQSRIPTINPTVPRIDPNIAGRAVTAIARTPNLRTYPACSYAYRNSDGECSNKPVLSTDGGGTGGSGGASGKNKEKNKSSGPRRIVAQTALNQGTVAGHLVAEIDGSLSGTQADELARRHGLVRLQSQDFPLLGATIGLFRITDRRTVETASRQFATDASVHWVQPNFRYFLQEQKAALTEGDPAQYALAKLRLPQAHTLDHGANVTVAVIDSGVDVKHPELATAIAASYDALGSKEGPHVHGTGIAGAIVSHARLMGSAPAARILAIRAFAAAPNGGGSPAFVILQALPYPAAHRAQNSYMSFPRPHDAVIRPGGFAAVAEGTSVGCARRQSHPPTPVATVSDSPAGEIVPDRQDAPVARAPNHPPAAMASDKSAVGDADRPAAR